MDSLIEFTKKNALATLSASAGVFVTSFLAHTVLPHHKGDFKQLPGGDDDVIKLLKAKGVTSGAYMVPYCGAYGGPNDKVWMEKVATHPHGFIYLQSPIGSVKHIDMTPTLRQSFLYNLAMSGLVAWTLSKARVKSQDELLFTTVITASFYSAAQGWSVVWYHFPPSNAARFMFDALAYGVVTAVAFKYLRK
eukprot:g44175.t1